MIKYKISIIALMLFTIAIFGQRFHDPKLVVQKTHPYFKVLLKHLAWMKENYYRGNVILASYGNWQRVESESASIIFPNLKFYSISWDEKNHSEAKERRSGLACGLAKTVGINTNTGRIEEEILCHLAFKGYCKLLIKHQVRILNATDAKNIWNAYCAIYHWHHENKPVKKISDSEWHLGISSFDDIIDYTDTTRLVVTIKSHLHILINRDSNRVLSCKYKQYKSNKRTLTK